MQWQHHRLRRVLDAAISSPISPEVIAEAAAAVAGGYNGSIARVPSASAHAHGTPVMHDSDPATHSSSTDADALQVRRPAFHLCPLLTNVCAVPTNLLTPCACVCLLRWTPRRLLSLPIMVLIQPLHAQLSQETAGAPDEVEAELARRREELDVDSLEMILALDHLWAGESGQDPHASP